MATNKSQKLTALISRTGLWDEGIGFVFLGIAVLSAWGFASESGSEGLFSIGLLAGLAQVFVILYALVGVAFIVTGYYLHSVQGKKTKVALIASTALSVLAIVNIIPLIPAIFSVYALKELANKKLNSQIKKRPAGYDPRDYPAISAMLLLVLVTVVSLLMGLGKSNTPYISPAKLPVSKTAACESSSESTDGCIVNEAEWGFKATFPGKPEITTRQFKGGNPTSSYDQDTIIGNKIFTYYGTNRKVGSDNITKSYAVVSLDYKKTLDNVKDGSFIQESRLQFGANARTPDCIFPDGKDLWQLGTATTYQGMPAFSVSVRDGKTFSDQSCSVESLSIMKGAKVFTIQYVANPADPDEKAFNAFLQSFSLTQ